MKTNAPVPHDPELEELAERAGPRWWVAAWDRFFFSPADPATLGLIRICAGLGTLFILLCYFPGLLNYVGPTGTIDHVCGKYLLLDMQIYQSNTSFEGPQFLPLDKGSFAWSVYYHLKDPASIYLVHTAITVSCLLFTLGLWTRVTSVLTWLGMLQYVQRAPTMQFGMDTMMMILLLYLMIGDSGAAYSLDRWRAKRRARLAGEPEPPSASVMANFGIRLIQVHFCFVYAASGFSKLLGGTWWSGTAIWLTVANGDFAPVFVPGYVSALQWLCEHRWAWSLVITGGTWSTLLLECGFPFLVWNRRLRWICICGSVALHTGIGLLMGLSTFSLMMITMVLAFMPPAAVRPMVAALWDHVLRLLALRKGSAPPPLEPSGKEALVLSQ